MIVLRMSVSIDMNIDMNIDMWFKNLSVRMWLALAFKGSFCRAKKEGLK